MKSHANNRSEKSCHVVEEKSLVVHIGNQAILIGRNQCENTGMESMSEEHDVKQQWRIDR